MEKKKSTWSLFWPSMKDAFKGFSDDKVPKLSASLAYYTVFSLGPMLIVIIFLAGVILGREAAEGDVYNQIKTFIGPDAAAQIQTIITNAAISDKGGLAATIGIITLLIGATTVFGELQDSINSIWGVKAKPKAGIIKLVLTRLLSFGMIASLGFLLLVSLAVTAVVEAIGVRLKASFPDVTVVVLYIINLVMTIGITTLLFAFIFKVLPDIKIRWKNIWPGAIATSLLFLVGKFAISVYLSTSDIGSTFGAAGSLVILLVWIYYSSIILYFGVEFTRALAEKKGVVVEPTEYAVLVEQPTVPGAKTPEEKGKPVKLANSDIPDRASGLDELKNGQKTGKAGLGTIALGLLLYFFNQPGSAKKNA